MIIEQIKESLKTNSSITSDIKNNLLELVVIFNKNFPNVSLNNLNNRLKTFKIDNLSKYLTSEISKYDPLNNILKLNIEKLKSDVDAKHILMFELLAIITAKDNYNGFNYNNQYEALNIGYREILTNNLVGNESELFIHDDEIIATNLITVSVGDEILQNSFFNNDHILLSKKLVEVGIIND